MSVEIGCLYAAVLLGLAQLMLASHVATLKRGFRWNLSSREKPEPPLTGVAGRLDRSYRNFLETFVFFVAAILIVQVTGRNSDLSALGARIYLTARVIYVPIYAAGVVGLRSMIWLASVFGIAMILYAAIA